MAIQYKVKKGDTLNDIAKKFGYKNYIDAGITGYKSGNPDIIYPNEVLTIKGNTGVVSSDIINNNRKTRIPKLREDNSANYNVSLDQYLENLNKEKESYKSSMLDMQKGIEELSSRISSFDTSNEQEEIRRADELRRQALLKMQRLNNERKTIPIILQEQAQGRGITTSEADKISFSQLRKNALESLSAEAEYNIYSNNYELARDALQRRIDLELEPKKIELDNRMTLYKTLLSNYSDANDRLGKYISERANKKIKEAELELKKLEEERRKAQQEIDKQLNWYRARTYRKQVDYYAKKIDKEIEGGGDDDTMDFVNM